MAVLATKRPAPRKWVLFVAFLSPVVNLVSTEMCVVKSHNPELAARVWVLSKVTATNQEDSMMLAFISTPNNARAVSGLKFYRMQENHTNGIFYYFVNYTDTNSSHTLIPPHEYTVLRDETIMRTFKQVNETEIKRVGASRIIKSIAMNTELVLKLIFAMKYFLYETNHLWLWRGSDDAVVHMENLQKYRKILANQYRRDEAVILGNCIDKLGWYNERNTYLQGGSGMLMSRAAVTMLLPRFYKYLNNLKDPDDIIFGLIMDELNWNWEEATSMYFIGHPLKMRRKRRNCSEVSFGDTRCKRDFGRIGDLVFFHEQYVGARATEMQQRRLDTVLRSSPNVRWYMNKDSVEVCE